MKTREEILTLYVCWPPNRCKCDCPDGDCDHQWDGPIVEDGPMSSVTCSVCGDLSFNHSMRVGP